ncbi:MAG TPA: ATP-binding protein [Steroidobacteraceae bacterium]
MKRNDFLAGGGEMGKRMRALDWTTTPLGEPSNWPQSLKTMIRMMLHSRYAMWMLWGPGLTFFCNDAYVPTLGIKKDWALGARSDKVWEEIWPDIGPRIANVLEHGEATWDEGLLLFLERSGFLEETYHTFSYSPVHNDESRVAGMLCVVTEITDRTIGERHLKTLGDLAARGAGAENLTQVWQRQALVLEQNPNDLPFSCLYVFNDTRTQLEIGWRIGAIPGELTPTRAAPHELSAFWPIDEVERSGKSVLLDNFTTRGGNLTAALWQDPVKRALVLPVRGSGVAPTLGFLIVGLSPRLAFNDKYRSFLELIAAQIAAALSDAKAYQSERQRARALQEIDRAKTAFFSNVSHEFRTPLTLILGPLEDMLTRGSIVSTDRQSAEVAHRNSLRLLKLVNSLLDFSRIEAGRAQASFEPTDLAAFTKNLASMFRSLIERAGLAFSVICEPLPKPVYVDREMWEKIVLNLLSNAFKFTLSGGVRLELAADADGAILTVRDSGVGVPPEELPRLFERFHRVQGSRGRTHEGSGIGLALVQELVKLHGGAISAESILGEGTTFLIRIPFGMRHVPDDQLRALPTGESAMSHAPAFVHEASRWLPRGDESKDSMLVESSKLDRRFATTFGARIILADDNADMRAYVRDLLAPFYRVEAVGDGLAAIEAARRSRPALIVSDVMMPNLDGFGLLQQIRTEPELQGIPIILLSARAGDDSRIEGLDAGADDYLIKPFAARELLARVGALIELMQLRQVGEERLRLAIEGARMSTWDLDLETGRAHWSSTHFELLGYQPRSDGIGSYTLWRERLHPEDAERIDTLIADAARAQGVYQAEHRIIRADTGEVRWLSVYGRFLSRAESGIAGRSIGIMLDVTDRKRAEESLREADRRKDEFLATLAHEMRNPLAPIRNAAQILAAERLQPNQLAWCREVIQRQTTHMSLLLDDLLDISRVTLGRLQLKKEPVNIAAVVASAVETARPLIDSRHHHLRLDLPLDPVLLEVDPLRIAQVLANLLTNAAKYTDPGGDIILSVRPFDHTVEIAITDTGIGLDREDLHQVFTMFSQVDSALDRSQGGLGIGLALVKGLIQLHDGTVRAESEGAGRGCKFIVELPGLSFHDRDDRATVPTVTATVAHSLRILIADDNLDASESLAMLLQIDGHEVRTVSNGADAFLLTETFKPHVALIDIGMPRLNGYEVAQLVRREPWGTDVRLVALTGWGQDDNKRQALDSGFDHHLTKPIDPAQIGAILVNLLQP